MGTVVAELDRPRDLGHRLRHGGPRGPRPVDHALDRGITSFDAADRHGEGEAERILGRGLKGQVDRVVLTTTVFTTPQSTPDGLMRALEASLRRLQTDCTHQACTGACPFGLEIEMLTAEVHVLLGGSRGASASGS